MRLSCRYERAAEAKGKGDIHGRVDFDSLGKSLHEAGYCLMGIDKYDAALPWFERAVEATEKGDVHGRVDYDSVGSSLHGVASCLSVMSEYDEALVYFQRALEAKKRGNLHGRADDSSIIMTVNAAITCIENAGNEAKWILLQTSLKREIEDRGFSVLKCWLTAVDDEDAAVPLVPGVFPILTVNKVRL